jgi:hypothetical protein
MVGHLEKMIQNARTAKETIMWRRMRRKMSDWELKEIKKINIYSAILPISRDWYKKT